MHLCKNCSPAVEYAAMWEFQANRWLLAWVLGVIDAITIIGGGVAAAWIRFVPHYFHYELTLLSEHPGFIAYAVLLQWGLATTFDLYLPESWRGKDHLLARTAALAATLPVALTLGVYLVPAWRFGRGLLLLTMLIAIPLQLLVRLAWYAWGSRPHGKKAVLVGDGPIVAALLEELEHRSWPPYRIIDRVTSKDLMRQRAEVDRRLAPADLIIVAALADQQVVERITALNFRGTTVIDAAGAYADLTGRIPVRHVDSRWFIATGDFSNLATSPFNTIQRMLDLVASISLLILGSPVMLAAAVGILLTDGCPVLYRQQRLGRFHKPFTLYKLRTMKIGAEENGPEFAGPDDPRVLKIGAFMRRWRIDELPQLVNVLKGDMSLVGPRPERPEMTQGLEDIIPFFGFRYSVRPGLSGWAQVNHPYASDIEDHYIKLEYDLYSLRHHGPTLYFMVVIRTLGALIFQPGL